MQSVNESKIWQKPEKNIFEINFKQFTAVKCFLSILKNPFADMQIGRSRICCKTSC